MWLRLFARQRTAARFRLHIDYGSLLLFRLTADEPPYLPSLVPSRPQEQRKEIGT